MPTQCCVPKCNSNYYKRMKYVSVFRFPKDEEIRKKWIAAIPRNDTKIRKSSRVCALHFVEADFVTEATAYNSKTGKELSYKLNSSRLKKKAVPSKFSKLSKKIHKRGDSKKRKIRLKNEQMQLAAKESLKDSLERQHQFENTDFKTTSRSWKKDEITVLIALFQSEKCLYDKSHADYYHLDKRKKAYGRIQNMLQNICHDCTIFEIETEINSLHKQYVSEKLYKDWNIKVGLFTEDTYAPEMWCFGFLQFLDDYIMQSDMKEIKVEPKEDVPQNETSTSNYNIDHANIKIENAEDSGMKLLKQNRSINNKDHEEELDKECYLKNHDSSKTLKASLKGSCTNNKSKRKETKQSQKFSPSKMTNFTKIHWQDSTQRDIVFGRYIASEMRTLKNNPLLYLKTKQAIIDVITNANFECLNSE